MFLNHHQIATKGISSQDTFIMRKVVDMIIVLAGQIYKAGVQQSLDVHPMKYYQMLHAH